MSRRIYVTVTKPATYTEEWSFEVDDDWGPEDNDEATFERLQELCPGSDADDTDLHIEDATDWEIYE